jgi:localization factor PodJL
MSAGGPWSVKGIDPRARARAKTAARREGVTLGEWLNRVLLDDSDPAASQWEDALGAYPAFGGAQAVNDDEDRLLRAMVNRLSERVESSEQLSSKALTGLDTAVTQLADKIGQADSRHATSLSEARKNIEAMLESQKGLNERIDSLETPDTPEQSSPDATNAVETSVMRLARRLYESENDIAARLHETEQQTRELSDTSRKTADSLETRIERMEARASDFGDLSKRRDQRTAEALTGLHQATEKLQTRIDGSERLNNESSRGLDATAARLEERLRAIETRNSGDNVELERRFDRMSDDVVNIIADTRAKLDRAVAENKADPRVDRLEATLGQALQRIDEADRRQGDSMSRLGDEITRLAGAIDKRMSESEQRTLIAARDARSEQNLDRKLDVVRDENKSAMRRMGEEVTRLGHSLADRIVKSEEKSAASVENVSDRMASAIERMEEMRVAREDDLDDRLRSTEERTAKRIEDAMSGVQENLASMRAENAETMTPVQRAMSALADRLEAIEKGDEDDDGKAEDANAKNGPVVDFDTPLSPPPQAETPVGTFESEERDPFLAINAQSNDPAPVAAPILRQPAPEAKASVAPPQSTPTPPARPRAKIGATADPDFLAAARARTQTDGRAYGYAQSTPSNGGSRMFIGGALAVALIAVSVLLFIVLVGEDEVVSDTTDVATSENLIAHMEAEFAANDGAEPTTAEPAAGANADSAQDNAQMAAATQENTNETPEPVTSASVPGNVVADATNTITPEPPAAEVTAPTRTVNSGRVTLEQAATNGDPVARYMLGMRRQEAGDLVGASILLRRAAEQGVPAAQYRFAKMLETGEGVDIDLEAARRWTERAANSGHRRAMHNLAIMNFYGAGVPQDFETAARWFQEASLLGLRDSQFNLALLYEQGQGLPLSLPDAYAWYLIAASDNDPTASQRAADLVAQMTADARLEAQQVAANFQPTPLDAEANGLYQNRPWDRTTTSNRQSVQRTQGFLSVLGYAPGPIDGTMGEQTRQAIMSFEADHGLPRTGRVDAVLIERLEQAVSG